MTETLHQNPKKQNKILLVLLHSVSVSLSLSLLTITVPRLNPPRMTAQLAALTSQEQGSY